MKNCKIAYVFCCEYGILERLSKVLVNSLLKYGQIGHNSTIYCFCPRKKFQPKKSTIEFFERLNVKVITDNLNNKFSYYPIFNKVVASAYIEKYSFHDYIVFFDSDILVLNDLYSDKSVFTSDISVQKEFIALVSAFDENDSHYSYWAKIFDILHVKVVKYSKLFVENIKTIAYWNSGFFVNRLSLGLMSQWKENLEFLLNNYHWRNLEYFFLDQVSLSATIQKMGLHVKELPRGYNYPISMHDDICAENKIENLSELIVCHYLKEYPATLENLKKLGAEDDEKIKWVEEQFNRYNIYPKNYRSKFYDFAKSQRNINLQKLIYFSKKLGFAK